MSLKYPKTRSQDATDSLAGLSFADPYRWLEDDTDEVRQWQREQAALAERYVRDWPHFERLKRLVERFSAPNPGRSGRLPRYAAGRWFRTHVPPGAIQAQAVVSDTIDGEARVLFDPATENPTRPPFLSWLAPSPDGRTLALGVCADGSENNTIRLIDVERGRMLEGAPPHVLMDNWTGGISWLPDSSGFFFSAITGTATDFSQQVYLHRRSPYPGTEMVEVDWALEISPSKPRDYRMVVISNDGRHAVAMERRRHPIPVAIATLADRPPLRWRPFINAIGEGIVAGHAVGDRFIAVTDVGADRGRLVAIPLDAKNPNDPASWVELVSESAAVMRTVTPVRDVLYLHELVETYSRLRIVGHDGHVRGEVPLPHRGALSEHPFWMMNLVPRGHPDKLVFGFSSLTVSPGIYAHTPGQKHMETLKEPLVRLENAIVEDRHAISADGTDVPYHILRSRDLPDGARPTLILAYGGFNAPHAPHFPGLPFPGAAFVASGGVFVLAHLRGGGELGRRWWDGGRWRNKQNSYDDLFAVAEHLIATGRTSTKLLAVTGGSNGGLMAGVAVTQRPELWGAVVPRFPNVDLIGACREPYGRQAVMSELCADIESPEEVRHLAAISPYCLVRDSVEYPAVYLDAGNTDPRCAPWQARKFAARLQAASAGNAPILLHVWENVGHGGATDKETALAQNAEWLAFVMRQLGMDVPATS